ncbi:hypothetical protein R6Q59_008348 [Mikania micrantha]
MEALGKGKLSVGKVSSILKLHASIFRCKKYLGNDGVKFEELKYEDTKLLNESAVEKHENAAKESDGIASDTDKCVKYTFNRRHKKVLSSKSDNCSSHGKRFLTGQVREKPSFNHDDKNPSSIEDSSSDSQSMIDIACQLQFSSHVL